VPTRFKFSFSSLSFLDLEAPFSFADTGESVSSFTMEPGMPWPKEGFLCGSLFRLSFLVPADSAGDASGLPPPPSYPRDVVS